jgi:hypothetical protein
VAIVDNVDRNDSSALMLLIAKKRISKIYASSRVEYLELPEDIALGVRKKSGQVQEYLIKNGIDAIFFIQFNKKDDTYLYNINLLLAANYRQVGELSGPVKFVSKQIDTVHRSDIYTDGKNYSFIKEVNLPSVDIQSPGETNVQDFWAAVTSGMLNVRSSTPGAEVSLIKRGKKTLIGRTPVNEFRLDEGEYEVEIFRHGLSPVRKSVEIIAGSSTNVFVPWPDDPYTTSLAFWTGTESMKFSLDGESLGETPVFLNDIEGGSYDISLARKKGYGNYKDVIKTSIAIRQGQVNMLVFFYKYIEQFGKNFQSKEFWSRVSEKGRFEIQTDNGLGFAAEDAGAIVGIESIDFPIRSFDASLTIESKDNGYIAFGIKSLLDSVLIQENAGEFSGGVFQPDMRTIAMPSYKEKDIAKKEHVLRIKFRSSNSTVQLYVDGTLIGQHPWKPDAIGKFVIYGKSGMTRAKLLNIDMQGK